MKFRYWDDELKQFVYSTEFGYGNPFIQLSAFFNKAATYSKVVEQWTGIQDSQRKDIYEGDIVEYEEYYDKDDMPQDGADTYMKRSEVYKADGYFTHNEDNPFDFCQNVSLKLVKGAVPWNTHLTVVSHIHLNS